MQLNINNYRQLLLSMDRMKAARYLTVENFSGCFSRTNFFTERFYAGKCFMPTDSLPVYEVFRSQMQ